MSTRPDSYGSVADVQALTRHLLDGAATFGPTTRPTLVEVEGMVNRWSAMLNVALRAHGVAVPLVDEVAVLAAAQWVIRQAAAEVELTQRGTGYSDEEGSRLNGLRMDDATAIAAQIAAAIRQGDAVVNTAAGLSYTGAISADCPPTPRVCLPAFRRGQFDL